MVDDEVIGFLEDNQSAIQRVVDFFALHRMRTGHWPVAMWIEGKEEYVCECGLWDVKGLMASYSDDLLA